MHSENKAKGRLVGILLVGPTGVGKTPLGDYAEKQGFQGRHCTHFDFGENLRRVAQSDTPDDGLSRKDIAFIQKVLEEGALLENETFYIAAEILKRHIASSGIGPDGIVILNGLPRHLGQARAVDRIIDIQRVLNLQATPEIIHERICKNMGGDRATRTDDDTVAVSRKLGIFRERTQPLIDHYRQRHIPITNIKIGVESNPAKIWNVLS